MMRYHHRGWLVADRPIMALLFLTFVGVMVALVWFASRSRTSSSPRHDERQSRLDNATALLADRFARGEIDEDEYVHRRDVLFRSPGGGS